METKKQKAARLAAEALAKSNSDVITDDSTDDGIASDSPVVKTSLLEDRLIVGQCAITRARLISGGKLQLEFAEVLIPSYRSLNTVSLLNQGDSRFSSAKAKARKTYMAVSVEGAKMLGIDVSSIQEDWTRVDIMNPSVIDPNTGKKVLLGMQITETTTPNDYQASDVSAHAKRVSSDGEFLVCAETGNYVFVNYSIVDREKASHT